MDMIVYMSVVYRGMFARPLARLGMPFHVYIGYSDIPRVKWK